MHFHWRKREDIINRGGGNLIVELWNAGAHQEPENTDVTVTLDGCLQTHAPGSQLRLQPGDSICLTPVCTTVSGVNAVLATYWWGKCHR